MDIILFIFGGIGLSMIVMEYLHKIDLLRFFKIVLGSYLIGGLFCGMIVAWILFNPIWYYLPLYGCVISAVSVFFSRYLNYLEAVTLANLEVVAEASIERNDTPKIIETPQAPVNPQSKKSCNKCGSRKKKPDLPPDMIVIGDDLSSESEEVDN